YSNRPARRRHERGTMTAAPVKTGLTAEEFLALPESDNYELIDGELVERKRLGLYSGTITGRVLFLVERFNDAQKLGWTPDSSVTYRCFSSPRALRRADVSFI